MPTEVYEIIAQGARYWFLFLMALIVWRSFRWYRKDRRQYKKRLRLLPDAGYVGELVTIRGNAQLPTAPSCPCRGKVLSAPGAAAIFSCPRLAWPPSIAGSPMIGRTGFSWNPTMAVPCRWTTRPGRAGRKFEYASRFPPACGDVELRLRMFAALRPPHGPMCCGMIHSPMAGKWRQRLPS